MRAMLRLALVLAPALVGCTSPEVKIHVVLSVESRPPEPPRVVVMRSSPREDGGSDVVAKLQK
jgi:hypothetical protein